MKTISACVCIPTFTINQTLVLHMFVCTCNECCGKENHQMAITRLVTKCTIFPY